MQSVLSRIWTRIAMSISYDDNHYTMGTSLLFMIIMIIIQKRLLFLSQYFSYSNLQWGVCCSL